VVGATVEGTDTAAFEAGYVSVTTLRLDLGRDPADPLALALAKR
jgi:broad specificity polyphosphatase/5'/3'-nucleotidase SurE